MFLPSVEPIQQREEVVRFSDYMQKYLMNNSTPSKIGIAGNSLPEIGSYYGSNLTASEKKQLIDEQCRDQRNKQGAFLVPKTYNIVDSHYSSI